VRIVSNPAGEKDLVVAYQPIEKHRWSVVLEQPAAAAFATRDDQLRRIFFAYALNLTFFAAVAVLVSLIAIQHRQAASDRTTNAELEQRVAERTAQLETSNSELESFSYSVSHDLRAPLRAMDGFAEMLQESYSDSLDDEGRRKLRVIRESSQKLGQLIDDLLAFSRLGRQTVSATQVDMKAMAAAVCEDLVAASPGPHPSFAIGSMPGAWCDRALIRQVWVNLLANAVKFSGKRQNPAIEAGGHTEGTQNIYYVRDNGAGFDMRYYKKLFGVFERLHSGAEFPGTGVGLAIVQRIVTRHGGRAWAEGKVGEGATFYFALPAQDARGNRPSV
jgi:light-regulated signal transduction histidine kinase (bacteriophytochrome)